MYQQRQYWSKIIHYNQTVVNNSSSFNFHSKDSVVSNSCHRFQCYNVFAVCVWPTHRGILSVPWQWPVGKIAMSFCLLIKTWVKTLACGCHFFHLEFSSGGDQDVVVGGGGGKRGGGWSGGSVHTYPREHPIKTWEIERLLETTRWASKSSSLWHNQISARYWFLVVVSVYSPRCQECFRAQISLKGHIRPL